MKTRSIHSIINVQKARSFLNLAYKDYLAARVLLNFDLLLQGVLAASTCVEKYFKAIMTLRGNFSDGHLKRSHLHSIKNYDSELYANLNESFLFFLQKCYKLRYFDSITPGYSVAIIQRPTLAELDYTVSRIESRFTLMQETGKLKMLYEVAIADSEPNLYENNYVLQKMDKNTFIEQKESRVYAIRIDPPFHVVEIFYTAVRSPHDGNFLIDFPITNHPSSENPATGMQLPLPPEQNT
jgi:hypothetical protein